jgi:hypothetical protein
MPNIKSLKGLAKITLASLILVFGLSFLVPQTASARVDLPKMVAAVDCAKPENATKPDCNSFVVSDCASAQTGCGLIDKYLNPIIKVLGAIVGIVVTIMFIIGGIQYSAAGGDASKVSAAKSKIFNALIALLIYFFLFAILKWLVPGNLLG